MVGFGFNTQLTLEAWCGHLVLLFAFCNLCGNA